MALFSRNVPGITKSELDKKHLRSKLLHEAGCTTGVFGMPADKKHTKAALNDLLNANLDADPNTHGKEVIQIDEFKETLDILEKRNDISPEERARMERVAKRYLSS